MPTICSAICKAMRKGDKTVGTSTNCSATCGSGTRNAMDTESKEIFGHFDNLLGHQEIQDPQGVCNVFNNLREQEDRESARRGTQHNTQTRTLSHTQPENTHKHNWKHTHRSTERHRQARNRHTIRPKQRSRKKSRKKQNIVMFSFFISFIFRFGEVEAFDSRREEGGTHLDI